MQKPKLKKHSQIQVVEDERWLPYQAVYITIPVYCFNQTEFPISQEAAAFAIKILYEQIKTIQSQLEYKDLEINSVADPEIVKLLKQESYQWRIKAHRSQRMKHNQILLLQAVQLDLPSDTDNRLAALELELLSLREAVTKLAELTSSAALKSEPQS